MKTNYTDRSRIETHQRCPRSRWLGYHFGGLGISSSRKPLPLAVGGSVHEGLAVLLKQGSILWNNVEARTSPGAWLIVEEAGVQTALADFSKECGGGLELELSERTALGTGDIKVLTQQLMDSLGQQTADEKVESMALLRKQSMDAFDKFLRDEQAALVEGLVRAYARRRLRPLLEQFEVLEVEREGQWTISQQAHHIHEDGNSRQRCVWCGFDPTTNADFDAICWELMFMSRPDALLLERQSRQLYLLSFKTAASWDIRKAKDAERDMQGLSEGVEVEKRLGEWWAQVKDGSLFGRIHHVGCSNQMYKFLEECSAPPRILGIRYEYMLKGDRMLDKDLTAELGLEARSQRSPLVRAYLNTGMTRGDEQWNVSWNYLKDGGEKSNLYWKSWRGTPVWQHMTTKEWVDRLDQTVETIGEESRLLGWSGPGQATGYLEKHPLDELFIPPVVVYRNDDDLRDWLEQTEAQEVRVAEAVEQVSAARDEGGRRHLLNVLFPQTRRACEYPTTCAFVPVCFGGDEIRRDPVGSGKYAVREANHPQELAGATTAPAAKV